MSLQICLNCKELGMTWYGSDDRMMWYCSECEFEIEEDESKESFCGNCQSLMPSASWLMKDGEGFYWCFSCNEKIDRILEDTTEYNALLKEFSNLK
jgi:hypothetical protein